MNDLTQMPNIGKTLAECLQVAGVSSPRELKSLGSRQVFLRIKLKEPGACINKLFALEGAVQGIRWHNLSDETKRDLKEFYNSL